MEAIINGWWKVLALLGGVGVIVWVIVLATIHLIKKAKESGIDEVTAGPVKVDFDDEKK